MMEKLIQPQEVEVFYLLPALRRDIAISLKILGKDQKQIAKILGVSEPSVSHYFNSKRGAEVEFSDEVKEAIQKSAAVISTPQDTLGATQQLLQLIHAEREICKVCHDVNKTSIPKGCTVCYH